MIENRQPSPGTPEQSEETTAKPPGDIPLDERSNGPYNLGVLGSLGSVLRRPVPDDDFEEESGCRRAIELVATIGRDPSVMPGEAAPPLEMLGQYELLAKLGEGGMGAVYKALHTLLQKVVALKVLPADKLKDAGAVARFRREMRAVGQLNHPNIVGPLWRGAVGKNSVTIIRGASHVILL
jgi:serine/threonine protein kinase